MSAFEYISSMGAGIASFAWLPLLIWTLLAVVVLATLYIFRNIHVQYHYHIRLALLFSLPAGLLVSGVADAAAAWMDAGNEMAAGLKFIYVQSPVEITAAGGEEVSSLLSPLFWSGAGMIIFTAGAVFLTFRHLKQYFQLNLLSRSLPLRPVTRSGEVSPGNRELVRECGRPVYMAYLDRSVIPVTYGLRKPVVLLPSSLEADAGKMNLVLRHELIHIRNRDYLTQLVMSGIRTLFWVHPLVHLIYHQLIDYREMRCDSHVLSDDSISRKKYASVLLDLLPMPNLNKNVSVNMAQESSNIKQRIEMMKFKKTRTIPLKASFSLFTGVIMATVLVMSCTDMQTHTVFDDEELNLMTDVDRTGERGYHEIIIYLSDQEQADRHEAEAGQLSALHPEHIESVNVWKGEEAVAKYGSRGEQGVIVVRTRQDMESYHAALRTLGMAIPEISPLPPPPESGE